MCPAMASCDVFMSTFHKGSRQLLSSKLIVVFSGGRDNIVTVWDIKAFERKKTIPVYEVRSVFFLSF